MKKLSKILLLSVLSIFLLVPFAFLPSNANATLTSTLSFEGLAVYVDLGNDPMLVFPDGLDVDPGDLAILNTNAPYYLVGGAEYVLDIPCGLEWDQDYNWTLDVNFHADVYSLCGPPDSFDIDIDDITLPSFSLDEAHSLFAWIDNPAWFGDSDAGFGYYLIGDHEAGTLFFASNMSIPCIDEGLYLVCFEGDLAFNAHPIPEPATMLLLGSGLVGIAAFGRKKFFKK